MSYILNIDTAVDTATVCLAWNAEVRQSAISESMKDHASWLLPAIKSLLLTENIKVDQLSAIAVSNGPGSYTGLRVGLSTAKGLCYALKIPLVTISSLKLIAASMKDQEPDLICPMIDARRMEVYTAIYDQQMVELVSPQAIVLQQDTFEELLKGHKILFLGNGSTKFQKICKNGNASFKISPLNLSAFARLTYEDFIGNNFVHLAYTEPQYVKEVFTNTKKTESPRK